MKTTNKNFLQILFDLFTFLFLLGLPKCVDCQSTGWEDYFKQHLNELDPIEGVYNVEVQIRLSSSYGHSSEVYRSQICIIRNMAPQFKDRFMFRNTTRYPEGLSIMLPSTIAYRPFERGTARIEKIGSSYYYTYANPYYPDFSSQFSLDNPFNIGFKVELPTSFFEEKKFENPQRCKGSVTFSLEKIYPTISEYLELTMPKVWSGTGFAISNNYIITNNHVVEDAKKIIVKGIKGDINTGYSAEVVATDKTNDLAVLKITDSRFKGFGTIPYCVSTRMADVGEDIFVLGYPLTQALGNEIKLTNGIISSKTGYKGDVACYQMTAPVQPGNSGGPMFDSKGNVIGIVVAGIDKSLAENVGYTIKTSFLKILIESAGLNIQLPSNNSISTLSLAEKVKRIKNFVFYIECSR